jgi:hypothetical protein
MPLKTVAALKAIFVTAAKPTQQDFHDWMDSFWHKGQLLPTSSVDGLPAMLDGKISKQTVAEQPGGFWVSTGRFARYATFDGLTADHPAAENGSLMYRSDLKRLRFKVDGIPHKCCY